MSSNYVLRFIILFFFWGGGGGGGYQDLLIFTGNTATKVIPPLFVLSKPFPKSSLLPATTLHY